MIGHVKGLIGTAFVSHEVRVDPVSGSRNLHGGDIAVKIKHGFAPAQDNTRNEPALREDLHAHRMSVPKTPALVKTFRIVNYDYIRAPLDFSPSANLHFLDDSGVIQSEDALVSIPLDLAAVDLVDHNVVTALV